MLWKTARKTLVAAIVIGVLAAGWQLVAGPETTAAPGHHQSERAYHDD